MRCGLRARRSRTCSRAPCCSRPISAMTPRPTGRIPAAGPAPTFRASWRCRHCAGSESTAASSCRRLPSRCRRIPNGSSNSTYSYRLMRNFATRGYKADLRRRDHPITLISGAGDELMLADKYAEAVHAVAPSVDVKLIDGVDHMGIVGDARAVAAVADDVAKRRPDHDQHRCQEARAGAERYRADRSRVRQSRIYDLASQIMIAAASWCWPAILRIWLRPWYAGYIWPAVKWGRRRGRWLSPGG